MADANSLASPTLGAWTDPRMMLAQQLMQGATDATPVRSWTQELARALSGPVGAYEARSINNQNMDAYAKAFDPSTGASGAQSPSVPEQPGLLGRIGNWLGMGDTPASSQAIGGSATPTTMGGASPAPQSAIMPSAMPAGASPTSAGSPQPSMASGAPNVSGASPVAGNQPPPPNMPASSPVLQPGVIAQQVQMAQRLMAAGKESGNPAIFQQGAAMMLGVRQKMAEQELAINTELAKQGMQRNADGSVGPITGYNPSVSATKAAEAQGTALGGLDPSVTAGKIAQTNAVNTGTMGTDAAKAGAVANATAMGTNAPNVAGEEAAKAGQVANAQAQVALATQPTLEAAKASAVNAANAGKPLTPEQKNAQEQKLSQDFQGTEAYKNHYNAVEGYKNVLTAAQGNDKASDINLIDGLVKMFNPGATVRQATFQNFLEHSQGVPDNVKGMVQGWYNNNQHLQPDTRAQLVQQATQRMDASRQLYNPVASFMGETAARQGLNPKNVIPPLIDPLTAREIAVQRGLIK